MGDAFLKLGRGDLAQSAYVKSLELDAHLAKSYIGLGTYGLTKGQYDLSMVHFQKAVTLAPTDEMATLGLGLAFQGLDLMKEAVRWVKRALEINPHNLSALYTMVKIAQETGDLHESESCLRRYLSLHPNDLNMMYALAGLLYQQGMYDEVLDWLAKLLAIDPLDSRTQQLLKMTKKSLARSRPEVQSA
jgi:tetratricopeptide (TPR) repeat protein